MAVFPIVKGVRARFTKVNSCGVPVPGPANYAVTSGFVEAGLSPVFKDAEEIEQTNAEGRICYEDRTPPERKRYNFNINFCQVNTCITSLLTSWQQVLNHDASESIGFRDQREVESDFGVAIEIWTGGKAANDCPVPEDDSIFSSPVGSGKRYGYLLIFATEFQMADLTINSGLSTFNLSGITFNGSGWAKGPWNVFDTDGAGTAGRLLTPIDAAQHVEWFRTPIAPPEPTPGDGCCPLDIAGVFTAPNFYYDGPGQTAAAIAPPQPACPASGEGEGEGE